MTLRVKIHAQLNSFSLLSSFQVFILIFNFLIMQVLDVLRCPSLKVLRYLIENPDRYHSKYQIIKYSGVSKPEKILERFVKAGWVKLYYVPGFLRLYKINLEKERGLRVYIAYSLRG